MAADAEDNKTVIHRKVTFGEVEVRPYFVTAGDNPGCLSGAPLTLSWEIDEHSVTKKFLDEYETERGPKRSGRELFLDKETRDMILVSNGVTRAEINEATRRANIHRQYRRDTILNLKFEKVNAGIESFGRKFKRIVTRTSKEAEIEQLWKNAANQALKASLHGR